ncbi:3'(2'),5'-bisphosphate nucleotidase CysQ [Flavobacterium sp. MFBS3-15]|uniref:3'(2'),5'-bisphosphate nucleotidase CysQ n=1 Tax=Flavobacterium sp. MFBS3-15 TaxID=2989816 RepID=UPI0022358257|nr:3'(2'),5'-bisphosphate nucleotidase CysQ [Flavobacterium sp. MFBS3-15]MCW4469557.1 3'(2'),5'-bisphosphate nucleotidase CysQ [Flavobacterium sp. MFBS3-15]
MNQNYKTAIKASIEAGEAIMQIYVKDFAVDYKQDESPLTDADKAANEVIMEHLMPIGIPVISEENKQLPYEERKGWTSCWIVDPLDGTKEFIKKNGEFTVNIALVTNGVPQFGVIYVPAVNMVYYADAATGTAYRAEVKDTSADVEEVLKNAVAIGPARDDKAMRVVGSRSHMSQDTLEYVDGLKQVTDKEIEIVSKGSSLKFCLVAEGKADVYPRFAPTMEWDTAAGQAICKAVGVSVIDWGTKQEMQYNKENLLNPYFLVSYEG